MSQLVDGETAIHQVQTDQRTLIATDRRLLIIERSGDWSAVPTSSIAAVEVSDAGRNGRFLKLYFGGLSRTVSVPSEADAVRIVGALTAS